MTIAVTSIKLRKLWGFFPLTRFGFKITLQARKQPGFLRMKNTGFGYTHYTLSAWKDAESMKQFARSGAHLSAMKQTGKLGSEVRTYVYESETFPDWKDAKRLVLERGKLLSF